MTTPDFSSLPQPFTRADALRSGLTRLQLDEALRSGLIRRPHRDVYTVVEEPTPGTPDFEVVHTAHLRRLREELARHPGHVASHTSAAVVHGRELMISPATPVELTCVDGCPRSRREDGLVLHHSDSHGIPVEVVDGIRVTRLARTVADTMRTRTLPHATALADDVIRSGDLTTRAILSELDLMKRWPGRPRALVALELSDPRRETWLESFSDVRLLDLGVPLPLPQVAIYDLSRRFVARVDGLDPELGIVREADGEGKYFLGMAAGASAEESALAALAGERVRQAGLEGIGLRLVRWTTHQIRTDAEQVADRWKALRRQEVPSIQGYAEWEGELHRLPFSVDRPEVNLEKASCRRERRPRRRS